LVDYDGLISNITPLKQLEAQLRQAQKMEAVGQLAGGIAHDFNNILTAIIGYGNLLRMKLARDSALRTYVEQILASSERAANLTHSLLAFSRKQIIDLKPIDINAVITRVERLLQRLIGEDIEFRTVLCPGSLPVLADSVQMEQVLMNLVTNARDAMPGGGMLLIETAVFEMGEEFQRTHAYGKPGSYALVAVSDTGMGMDERTRAKIFDPFFTTKDVGKGTGLGLAMVYGIVKQHSGYINVYSEPGKGTSFKLYFPLTGSLNRPVPVEIPSVSHQGTETVLLAEDDAEVRKLTRTVLQDFGYRVIDAVDGEDAVLKFKADPAAVDLLVFDIIMPKQNGKEAYMEIRDLRPGIKALFMSGYTADVAHKKGILETGLDFVLKPISPTDFLKKVREVLDRKA
jgi:nitrogen-specific signal transduction histidine kinase/CheY-like chemotaxis protein